MKKLGLIDNVKLYFTLNNGVQNMNLNGLDAKGETEHEMYIDTINTNYAFVEELRSIYEPKTDAVFYNEDDFVKLDDKDKKDYIKAVGSIYDIETLKYAISQSPFVLQDIIGELKFTENQIAELVDIATANGASVYDLVDKGSKLSNGSIINIAVRNNPELVLELDDMPTYSDLITTESFLVAFVKNPAIILSDCKALKTTIILKGKKADGTEGTRRSNLRAQCLRAFNLYYRPEAIQTNGFDDFAKEIADSIFANATFKKALENKKLITRSTTLANECIKGDVSRSRYLPAQTFKLNNNKVLFLVVRQARKFQKANKDYKLTKTIILDFIKNESLATFNEKTKEKLARRCVEVCPEIFFELKNIKEMAETANSLTVQMSAYKTFKTRKQTELQEKLVAEIGEERAKKVVARNKANETRKKNAEAKKELEKELELK